MNCVCSYDGTIQESGGQFKYTGGRSRLRHIQKDASFQEFMKIMEDVCSNNKAESYITVKHMICGILCDVMDDSDYQAMFMSYMSNPQSPLQVWIVKESKPPKRQVAAVRKSSRLQNKRNININIPQVEETANVEVIEPYVPVRFEGDAMVQSAEVQRDLIVFESSELQRMQHDFMTYTCNDSQLMDDIPIGMDEEETDDNTAGDVGIHDISGDSSNEDHIPDVHINESSSDKSPGEFYVGQLFPSINELKHELATYAIFHKFKLKHKQTCPTRRLAVGCKSHTECTWRLSANKLGGIQTFHVMKYNPTHTCSQETEMELRASSEWIAKQVFLAVKDDPKYCAKDIQLDMHKKFGVDVSYKVAWRAKNIALKKIQEDFTGSYQVLVSYLDELKRIDPFAVSKLETQKDGNKFLRLFWTYGPMVRAFKNKLLRRFLIVDGSVLTDKACGTLMTAIAVDAEDCIFPLAFAIVDTENDDSWTFFLQNLRDHVIGSNEHFIIQSDMHQSLLYVVPQVFQNATHTYCIHDIAENIPCGLEEIKNKFMEAAQELSKSKYEAIMSSIYELDPNVYKYVHDIGEDHWAELHIQRHGQRYGICSKDYVESWNKMILSAMNQPITTLVETVRKICSVHFLKHMDSSANLTSKLTHTAENRLIHQSQLGRLFQIFSVTTTAFQVVSEDGSYRVNLEQKECTCNWWQVMGLPCSHALKCIAALNLCMYDFCEHWYTKETYTETYKEVWQPLRRKELWDNDPSRRIVNPPSFKRRPGPPKRRRIRLRKGPDVQIKHCSICRGPRHYRGTCTAEPE